MTDTDLLAACITKAGSLSDLAALATMPDRVTLWRWQRAGRIPTERQRALLLAYLDHSEAA